MFHGINATQLLLCVGERVKAQDASLLGLLLFISFFLLLLLFPLLLLTTFLLFLLGASLLGLFGLFSGFWRSRWHLAEVAPRLDQRGEDDVECPALPTRYLCYCWYNTTTAEQIVQKKRGTF